MSSLTHVKGSKWRCQIYVKGQRDSATFNTKREAINWGARREIEIQESNAAKASTRIKIGAPWIPETAQSILNKLTPLGNVVGVYVLFCGDEITYVGKSANMLKRILSHAEKGRKFTHYCTIPCLTEELDKTEQFYIEALDPTENRALFEGSLQRGIIAAANKAIKDRSGVSV